MKKIKGFSIVELIVILSILSLLIALTLPQFGPSQRRAKIKAAKGVFQSIMTAMEMWSTDNMSGRITPFYYPDPGPISSSLSKLYNVCLTPYLANYPGTALGYGPTEDAAIVYQTSADRSGYTLVIRQKDTNTPITAVRNPMLLPPVKTISGVYQGEEVPYP